MEIEQLRADLEVRNHIIATLKAENTDLSARLRRATEQNPSGLDSVDLEQSVGLGSLLVRALRACARFVGIRAEAGRFVVVEGEFVDPSEQEGWAAQPFCCQEGRSHKTGCSREGQSCQTGRSREGRSRQEDPSRKGEGRKGGGQAHHQ